MVRRRLCATYSQITPVREVDNRPIGEGIAGPITKKLQAKFFDVVRGSDNMHPEWLSAI